MLKGFLVYFWKTKFAQKLFSLNRGKKAMHKTSDFTINNLRWNCIIWRFYVIVLIAIYESCLFIMVHLRLTTTINSFIYTSSKLHSQRFMPQITIRAILMIWQITTIFSPTSETRTSKDKSTWIFLFQNLIFLPMNLKNNLRPYQKTMPRLLQAAAVTIKWTEICIMHASQPSKAAIL